MDILTHAITSLPDRFSEYLQDYCGCPRRHFCVWVLGFIGTASPRCHLLQPLQRIGILTHQQHQRRRLRIRLGAPLLPLLQRSHINPQLPRKDCPRTPHSLPSLPDELGIHRRKWPQFHLVAPQRQLPFAMLLHRFDALEQFRKNLSFCHYRSLLAASRAWHSLSIAAFSAFFSPGVRSAASFLLYNVISQI